MHQLQLSFPKFSPPDQPYRPSISCLSPQMQFYPQTSWHCRWLFHVRRLSWLLVCFDARWSGSDLGCSWRCTRHKDWSPTAIQWIYAQLTLNCRPNHQCSAHAASTWLCHRNSLSKANFELGATSRILYLVSDLTARPSTRNLHLHPSPRSK